MGDTPETHITLYINYNSKKHKSTWEGVHRLYANSTPLHVRHKSTHRFWYPQGGVLEPNQHR